MASVIPVPESWEEYPRAAAARNAAVAAPEQCRSRERTLDMPEWAFEEPTKPSSMDLTFVDATRDDHEAIADLWFRAQAARRPGSFVTIRDARTLVAERALAPDSCFILACQDSRTVGIAYLGPGRANDGVGRPVRGLMHVSTMAVEPALWGRGIATEMVRHVVELARERGARRIQLWTQADNLRAQRLYERLGFSRNGREKHDIRGESIVQYSRNLEPAPHKALEHQT